MNFKNIGLLSLLLVNQITVVQANNNKEEEEKNKIEITCLNKNSENSISPIIRNFNTSNDSNSKKFAGKICAGFCFIAVASGIITACILSTGTTYVRNKTDESVLVKRQYDWFSKEREEKIYPGETKKYPHATWDKLCVRSYSLFNDDEHCLSKDERAGGKGGCDDL